MANTPVPQGTVNRLRGSVSFPAFSGLNVTPAYLGKDMITITFTGDIVHAIPTATGYVTSPEPFQMVEVMIHILRTNGLGAAYKSQIETLATVGDFVVRSDVTTMPDYNFTNGSIKSADPIKQNGEEAGWNIHLQAAYQINASLYNL